MDLWIDATSSLLKEVILWNLFLDGCLQNNPDSVTSQKHQLLSNQSVKHNSAYMPSSNLTPKLFLNLVSSVHQ